MQVSTTPKVYTAKKWDLSGLQGISDATLEMHFGLYEGYVKNTNTLVERLTQMRDEGNAVGSDARYAELVRRLPFEYDGMRLHELYFDNLTRSPKEPRNGKLYDLLGSAYGSFEQWKKDLSAVAGMRGVGWAIAYYDVVEKCIVNCWVDDHQNGHIANAVPVVVLDVWEHAFIKDYKPAEKSKYIEAFFGNLDYAACEKRLP